MYIIFYSKQNILKLRISYICNYINININLIIIYFSSSILFLNLIFGNLIVLSIQVSWISRQALNLSFMIIKDSLRDFWLID